MPISDPIKRHFYGKDYRRKNKQRIKDWMRAYNLRRNFGISVEQYNSLLKVQKECCALCKKHQSISSPSRALAVDHDHKTGDIRGLVCYRCNGILEEGLDFFERGVEYFNSKPTDEHGNVIKRKPDVTEVNRDGRVVFN